MVSSPIVLPPTKEPLVRLGCEADHAPVPLWMLWSRKALLIIADKRTPVVQVVARLYTNWAVHKKMFSITIIIIIIIIIISQFNSIHFYLCANLTAQMPITKLARERRRDIKQKTYRKCKIRQFI
jgi:hypothetical protein